MAERLIPPRRFLRQCRAWGNRLKVADSMGRELSGRKLLIGTLLLERLLGRHVLAAGEKTVGVLLPPSVGGTVVNAALAVSGRVAVNLNYTLSAEQVNYCIREAGIKHVLTSRAFLEKRPMALEAEVVFVEELRKEKETKLDAAAAAFWGVVAPLGLLERKLGLDRVNPDDLLTIIFTSGSTGEPKGVMLSHENVGSNVNSIDELIRLRDDDTMLGVLPFFHAFGYTVTLWWPLCLTTRGVYHFNPLDARTVGDLCGKYKATVGVVTPTFLRSYLKRCTREQLGSLEIIISGAERLPPDLAEAFRESFGVTPSEGYGATELSPVASCNIPQERARDTTIRQTKPGTVGRPLPGVLAKVVDADTGAELGPDEEGRLLIGGPSVMRGYLNRPDQTAQVVRDGWYDTGDIAAIDAEGFIRIVGRLSRFSKIGGEMVPHVRIEETLVRICESCAAANGAAAGAAAAGDGEPLLAVTAVPDEKKGERLIVLHRDLPAPVDRLLKELAGSGIPNLWVPDRTAFFRVDAIPLLGSGKLDLRGIKDLALARVADRPARPAAAAEPVTEA